MSLHRTFRDPSFWLLLLFNLGLIWEYVTDPSSYATIIWIYWVQSVLIGVFNLVDLATTTRIDPDGVKINDVPVKDAGSRGCYSLFFLVHYGGFHLGYFLFLLMRTEVQTLHRTPFIIAVAAIFFNLLLSFIRQKQQYAMRPPKLSYLFFAPYLRIVPMHLVILLPAFLGWAPGLIFLLLKTVFDLLGHYIAVRQYATASTAPAAATPLA